MKALLLLLITFLTATGAPAPANKPTASEAKAKAAAWLKALPKEGLIIKAQLQKTGFVGRTIAGSNNTMFVLSDGPWFITLGFKGAVSESSSLKTLSDQFSYIALDRIPLTGLDLPGWDVRAKTPVSSIRKEAGAVKILKAANGRISFQVKTHFFAIYGSDPKVLVPADALAPKNAYFQVRGRFNLNLSIDAPFAFGK